MRYGIVFWPSRENLDGCIDVSSSRLSRMQGRLLTALRGFTTRRVCAGYCRSGWWGSGWCDAGDEVCVGRDGLNVAMKKVRRRGKSVARAPELIPSPGRSIGRSAQHACPESCPNQHSKFNENCQKHYFGHNSFKIYGFRSRSHETESAVLGNPSETKLCVRDARKTAHRLDASSKHVNPIATGI